jgi:hypothetical protein
MLQRPFRRSNNAKLKNAHLTEQKREGKKSG